MVVSLALAAAVTMCCCNVRQILGGCLPQQRTAAAVVDGKAPTAKRGGACCQARQAISDEPDAASAPCDENESQQRDHQPDEPCPCRTVKLAVSAMEKNSVGTHMPAIEIPLLVAIAEMVVSQPASVGCMNADLRLLPLPTTSLVRLHCALII